MLLIQCFLLDFVLAGFALPTLHGREDGGGQPDFGVDILNSQHLFWPAFSPFQVPPVWGGGGRNHYMMAQVHIPLDSGVAYLTNHVAYTSLEVSCVYLVMM